MVLPPTVHALITEFFTPQYRAPDALPVTKNLSNPCVAIFGIILTSLVLYTFGRFLIKLVSFLACSLAVTEFINYKLNPNYDPLNSVDLTATIYRIFGLAVVYTVMYYQKFFIKVAVLGALMYAVYNAAAKDKYATIMSKETEGFNVVALFGIIVVIVLIFK